MNGQSYDTVVPKSMNGTTPTPSSNSYPASISSSQSSRDGSPSRLVPSNNYINSTGANHITGPNQYKYPLDQNTNSSHLDYSQGGDGFRGGMYPPNSVGQVAKNQAKVISPQTNYPSSRPNMPPTNPSQNSTNSYQKPEHEDPVYSNIGPGLVSSYQKKPPTPSFNYSDQKSDTASQEGYTGEAPKTPTSSNYPATYPPQNYVNQQQGQLAAKPRDQPISSGPPRTNVLGIIPYSNEGVTSVARSGVATGVSSSQVNSSGTFSNTSPSYPASSVPSFTNQHPNSPTQSAYTSQTYPQQSPSQGYSQQQQQAYSQQSYGGQVPPQNYSQQPAYNSQPTQQAYTQQLYNSQQSYPQQPYNSQPSYNSQPYSQPSQQPYSQPSQQPYSQPSQQPYSQQVPPTSYSQQYQSSYTQQPYLAQGGYYQQNAYTNPPGAATGYQPPPSGFQGYPPQSTAGFTSQVYPKVSTASVAPLRPNYQQGYSQVQSHYRNDDLAHQMANLNVTQTGYNNIWGQGAVDLLKTKDILPTTKVEPPPIRLQQEANNCSPELFRCTLTKIPETKSLLDKSRLPLGVLIHPFKDLNQLSVIQCSVIVRCKSCRTYINPFVYFVDAKHWKCNLCYRVNELPEEFQYDPLSKTYGDPSRRPEIKSATIEFIAPSEYMVRPPQPAAYVFVLDVSRAACESGYLQVACDTLLDQLEALPGDARTAIAFITFDSAVHYYSLAENQSQPHQMIVVDVDDMFVPSPDNLLVNLSECLFLVKDLLKELPNKFRESFDTGSALGAALQAAYKLLAPTGGRVTVMCSSLVNVGPGSLTSREDPTQRSGENINHQLLNPVTDFYKKQALDCSGQQIAVDLFILNSMYVDLATISGISRFSGGCMHHFPLFNIKNQHMVEMFHRTLHRYLCRKIGFESVMRLRCTRGLSIHTFHGNFFVRSTDLLSLPNINPDAGFGMQVSIDENLTDLQNVCFQAALLYTSSKGERRIRVHTLCLPIASNLSDVLHGADQQCIVGLLSKMAVDRCHQSSLSDAREAFVNVVSDVLSVYKLMQTSNSPSSLMAPYNLSLLPLYILALLKYTAFRIGQSTRLDDRMFAMCQMKTLSLSQLMQAIYPDLYPVHNLHEFPMIRVGDEDVVQPPRLHLSAERIDCTGMYLMDDGDSIMLYVGHNLPPQFIKAVFDVPSFAAIDPNMGDLPKVNTPESEKLRGFISYLQNEKPISPVVQIIRNDDNQQRVKFLERLIEDKNESGHSYYEFLQNVKVYVK